MILDVFSSTRSSSLDKQKKSGGSWTQIKGPLVNIIPVWCQPNNPGWILKSVTIHSNWELSKKDRRKWSEDCGETLVDQVVVLVFTSAIGCDRSRGKTKAPPVTPISQTAPGGDLNEQSQGFAGCWCQRAKLKNKQHIHTYSVFERSFLVGSSTCAAPRS